MPDVFPCRQLGGRSLTYHPAVLQDAGITGMAQEVDTATACTRLEIAFSVVLLPAPLAPSSATISPPCSETPATERIAPL